MKRLIFITFFVLISSSEVIAQKHAPKLQQKTVWLAGIYPEASKRLLRLSDVEGLTSWDLKVMRNEIYARHGYIFKTQDMIDYFSQQDWYKTRYNNVNSMITALEKRNIIFIRKYE